MESSSVSSCGHLHGAARHVLVTFGFTTIDIVDIWAHGTLPNIIRLNIASWFGQVDYVITSGMIFRIYGCFLLGFAIGRIGIHARLESYSAIIKRTALCGLVIGIPLNIVYARTFESESSVFTAVATLGVIPLSAGYASVLAVMWMRNKRGLSDIFGQVGPTLYLPIGFAEYLCRS